MRKRETKDELRVKEARKRMPPLSRILNLTDIEVRSYFKDSKVNYQQCLQNVARKVMSHKAFAYYSSAADDEISRLDYVSSVIRSYIKGFSLR